MTRHPLDDCWYAVTTGDAVEQAPVAIELRGRAYVAWRDRDGGLVATLDRCSHRQAPLSSGTVEAGCLRCPYHGWVFGAAGRCVELPSSGEGATIPPSAHLEPVAVDERYGLVWLCPGEPSQDIPHLAVDDDDAFTRLNTAMQVWHCSATRMIDNMLDVAHFPFTHAGTFGREQEQVVPHFTLTRLDDTFHGYEYSVVVDNGIEQTLFMTAAPIDHERSAYTFVLWRNDDVAETGQQIVDFELLVAEEDRTMLERLTGDLPLDHGGLVDVQSDKASLEWRRRYRMLVSPDEA